MSKFNLAYRLVDLEEPKNGRSLFLGPATPSFLTMLWRHPDTCVILLSQLFLQRRLCSRKLAELGANASLTIEGSERPPAHFPQTMTHTNGTRPTVLRGNYKFNTEVLSGWDSIASSCPPLVWAIPSECHLIIPATWKFAWNVSKRLVPVSTSTFEWP